MIALLGVVWAVSPADRAQVDALVVPLQQAGILRGLSVGVVSDGQAALWTWGTQPGDRFELGAVGQGLSGALLADAIGRGELSLDSTVAQVLGLPDPTWEGAPAPISLVALATHTSGLPRLPDGFRPSDPADPYAGSTPASVLDGLRTTRLRARPDSSWATSHLGAAALGLALERATGQPYPALVRARLAGPLGLDSLSAEGPGPAGHDADGRPAPPWSSGGWAGATGLRATAPDLLKLVQALLDRPLPVGPALATATATQRDLGEAGGAGFGWQVAPDGTVWANGQTGGFHALIAVHPLRRIGVVAVGDTATEAVEQVGFAALAVLAGQQPAPIPARRAIQLPPSQLDPLVGWWGEAELRRAGETLELRRPDRRPVLLHATGPGRFFLRSEPVEIRFEGRRMVFAQAGLSEQIWRKR